MIPLQASRRISRSSLAAVFIALALVMSGCGNDDSASTTVPAATTEAIPGTDATTTTTEDGEIEAASLPDFDSAEPIGVSATVDADSAGVSEIGRDGGTVMAIAPDGATYTLTVPPGALLSPEEITVTPVTAVSGVPGELMARGVLLEPEGLVFLETATLAVELPAGAETADLFGAGTSSDGDDLHLTSLAVDGTRLLLDVPHFTLRLHGSGLEQLVEFMDSRIPGSVESWAREQEALLTRFFLDGSEEVGIDSPGQYGFEMVGVLAAWLDHLSNRFDNVAGNDSRLDAAVAELVAWESLSVGVEAKAEGTNGDALEALATEGMVMLSIALDDAAARARTACVLENDVDQAARLHRFATIASQFALPNAAGFVEMALRCATFEFRAESTFTGTQPEVGLELLTGVTFRTRLQPTTEDYDGVDVPIGFRQFSINQSQTSCSTNTRDGTARVRLDMNLNIRSPQPEVEQMVLRIVFPEKPTEIFRCEQGGSEAEIELPIWHELFILVHGLEGGFLPMRLVEEGAVVAADRFEGAITGPGPAEYRGTSDIEIIHTPE